MPQFLPLPFRLNSAVRITEGFHESFSHFGYLGNSVDFVVPINTQVVAMGRGKVIALWEAAPDGSAASKGKGAADPSNGPSDMGNFVTIYYPDLGIYVTYAHLKQNSVVPVLTPGKETWVSENAVLGLVGNTGYRTGTHLHVQYGTDTIGFKGGLVADGSKSLPFGFDTATGDVPVGIVSDVTHDLQKDSWSETNLTLVGSSNIDGMGDSAANVISGNRGSNTLDGRDGNDELYGGEGRDTLRGGHGNDRLFGGDHNDNLFGNEENDVLYGDGGDDVLEGGAGNDILYGGVGRDTLIGGSLKDDMTGGAGADTFVYNLRGDTTVGASRDVIRDFSHKDGDKIDLRAVDANENKSGIQDFTFVGSKAFSGHAGELALHGNILEGDVTGDGKADFQIQLDGVTSLQASDFIF